MSDLSLMISQYGLYLAIGIVWLVSITVIAVINAEECSLPAECFDCSESTCRKCNLPNMELKTGRWVWKPELERAPILTCSHAAGLENSLEAVQK